MSAEVQRTKSRRRTNHPAAFISLRVFAFRSRESKAVLAGFHPYFRQVHDDPLQQFSNKLSILAATFKIVLDLGFSAARSAKKSALAEAYLFEVERTLSSV